jgi:Zn-dependent peptidase ImmA (M78 family)
MMMINREIEQAAAAVYNKYVDKGNSHKQLLAIIQAEGIKYREILSANTRFVGAYTCAPNGQKYIIVNQEIDNVGRRNFTIAHELGHHFLKHQLLSNFFYCNEDDIVEEEQAGNSIERESNYFSNCLLMPEEKVKSAFLGMLKRSRKAKIKNFLHVKNDYTFGIWCGVRDDLTKRYGVSEAALRNRLRYLKLAQFAFI